MTNELRVKKKELEKVKGELDKIVYSCYHDLKAPVATLSGILNVVELESQIDLKYLDLMRMTIGKLDNQINKITNYSKNRNVELAPEELDLEEIVNISFEKLTTANLSNNIEKKVAVTSKAPLVTDKVRLELILNNVLSNAINFKKPNQTDHEINVKAVIDKHKITIHVCDNGIGIEKSQHKNIFKMFHKASQLSEGSGLGLFVVKEAVAKLKGSIQVISKLGSGSTFIVNLPNQSRY